MKKLLLSFCLLLTAAICLAYVQARVIVPLNVNYDDPTIPYTPVPKTPILIPHVSIEIHTLYFGTCCDGYTLQIVDENDDVAYSTVIPTGTTSLILPAYLFDTYELQLIPSNCNYYFYGTVDL